MKKRISSIPGGLPFFLILSAIALMGQGCPLAPIFGWDETLPPPTHGPLTIDDVANFETFPEVKDTSCEALASERFWIDNDYDQSVQSARYDFEKQKDAQEKLIQDCRDKLNAMSEIEVGGQKTSFHYADQCASSWNDMQNQYRLAELELKLGKTNGPEVAKYQQLKGVYTACVAGRQEQYDCIDTYQKQLYALQQAYRAKLDKLKSKYNGDIGIWNNREKTCLIPSAKPANVSDTGSTQTAQPTNTTGTLPPQFGNTPTAPAPKETASTSSKSGKYYVVPAGKTGKEVCSAAGKSCVGYPTDIDVCMMFHPGALPAFSINGSKAPYYCNGAPQSGVCGQLSNACNICTTCNLNENCDTRIGEFAREAFVECS